MASRMTTTESMGARADAVRRISQEVLQQRDEHIRGEDARISDLLKTVESRFRYLGVEPGQELIRRLHRSRQRLFEHKVLALQVAGMTDEDFQTAMAEVDGLLEAIEAAARPPRSILPGE